MILAIRNTGLQTLQYWPDAPHQLWATPGADHTIETMPSISLVSVHKKQPAGHINTVFPAVAYHGKVQQNTQKPCGIVQPEKHKTMGWNSKLQINGHGFGMGCAMVGC